MLIHKFRYFALSHSLKTINKSSLLCSVQLNRNENVVAFWMKCIEFELCVHLRVEMIIWATNKQTTAAAAICRMLFSVCLFFFQLCFVQCVLKQKNSLNWRRRFRFWWRKTTIYESFALFHVHLIAEKPTPLFILCFQSLFYFLYVPHLILNFVSFSTILSVLERERKKNYYRFSLLFVWIVLWILWIRA